MSVLDAARVVAQVLESPRDRLGRLSLYETQQSRDAHEELRKLVARYGVRGSDILDQCARALRAAITEDTGEALPERDEASEQEVLHFHRSGILSTRCGLRGSKVSGLYSVPVTDQPADVTCRKCLRGLAADARQEGSQ